jgi:hypothetical protein
VPKLASFAVRLTPGTRRAELFGKLESSKLHERFVRPDAAVEWTPDFALAYHFAYYANVIFLFACLLSLRAGLRQLPGIAPLAAELGPTSFGILLPIVFLQGGHVYDFAELFFLASTFAIAVSPAYWLLCAWVPLAIINKETAILLPVVMLPSLWLRQGPARALQVSAVSAGLGACLLFAIRIRFANNAGAPVEDHLRENLAFWFSGRAYFQFTSILAPGVPFPKPQNPLLLLPLLSMLAVGWKCAPWDERAWLVLVSALNLPLLLCFGWNDEIRNLSLMLVPMFVFTMRFFSQRSEQHLVHARRGLR